MLLYDFISLNHRRDSPIRCILIKNSDVNVRRTASQGLAMYHPHLHPRGPKALPSDINSLRIIRAHKVEIRE